MNQQLPAETRIRILVVDDHDVARAGVRAMLAKHPDIAIVDEATTGEQAIELMGTYAGGIDVVLMDIDMPGLGGIVATRHLLRQWPSCKVVLLSGFANHGEGAFAAGAIGYVLKRAPGSEIATAIRNAYVGQTFLSQQVQDSLLRNFQQPLEKLTHREYEVLADLREGLSNAKIAEKHNLTENTVKDYVSTILKKLDAENRTEAVTVALRRGLLQ